MISKKILLIDAFSTLHVGNGALLDNTYKLCKQYFGNEIEVMTIDIKPNVGRFPVVIEDIFTGYGGARLKKLFFSLSVLIFFLVESVNIMIFNGKLRFPWARHYRDFINAVDRSDICVSLSGETINDHYYPHMYQRLLTYYIAILKGKKFILFPQSIGPVYRPFSKYFLRKVLGNAFVILARDRLSLSVANELWTGKDVKILFCPDVATTQISEPVVIPGVAGNKKIVGLTVSDVPKSEMGFDGEYLNVLIDKVTSVFDKSEYQIFIMPSNYKHVGNSGDYDVSLAAFKRLKENGFDVNILPNAVINPEIYQGMLKALYLFVSTRMHVGILATSAGVPTLMINTQHKIRAYMELIDMESYVVELNELEGVDKPLKLLIENNNEIRILLRNKNDELQRQVHETISTIALE